MPSEIGFPMTLTTGAAIEIVKETTNNQYNKYSFGETCTETTIFIQEDK